MGVLYQLRCERSLACFIHCPESPSRRLLCLNNAYWNSPKVKCQSLSVLRGGEQVRINVENKPSLKERKKEKDYFFLVSLCFSEKFPWFNDITL